MPLFKWKKNIWKNIKELMQDNMKSWKEKGSWWKERPMKQIIAIALNVSKKKLKPKFTKK